MRVLLIALGFAHLLTGPVVFFAPHFFYDTVPGLSMMGPVNFHFIRDVGIAFAASGGAVVYGVRSAITDPSPLPVQCGLFCMLSSTFRLRLGEGYLWM